MAQKLEPGRVVRRGMGGFLNPPTHPEHDWHVQINLLRRADNRGGLSLSAAAKADWLASDAREEASRLLREWKAPPLSDPSVVAWISEVLGYFRGCYRNPSVAPERQWCASDLVIDGRDPLANANEHAGVNLIRRYYPTYQPTAEDFASAQWGAK